MRQIVRVTGKPFVTPFAFPLAYIQAGRGCLGS